MTSSQPGRVAECARAAVEILAASGDARAVTFAGWVDLWLAGAGRITFDSAAGLAPAWGRASARRMLTELARAHIRLGSKLAISRAMSRELCTFTSNGCRPPGRDGVLFDLMSIGVPTSAERPRKILNWSEIQRVDQPTSLFALNSTANCDSIEL